MENKKIIAAIIGICISGGFALVLILDWYFSKNILELILAIGIIVLLLFGLGLVLKQGGNAENSGRN